VFWILIICRNITVLITLKGILKFSLIYPAEVSFAAFSLLENSTSLSLLAGLVRWSSLRATQDQLQVKTTIDYSWFFFLTLTVDSNRSRKSSNRSRKSCIIKSQEERMNEFPSSPTGLNEIPVPPSWSHFFSQFW